jgi:pimeloyl-ACP methyl ester carboxylesterase
MIDIGGRRFHMMRRGEGGPTVVIESGGGGASSPQDWPMLARVAEFARVLSYDRAGLGWSEPAPADRTFAGFADDLDVLLAAAGEAPPFVLVGGSFGGLLVSAYCRRFPRKIAGAVFLDACDATKYFPTLRQMFPVHEAELKRDAERAERGELLAEAEPGIATARGLDDATRTAMRHVLGLGRHFEASLEEMRVALGAGAEEARAAETGSLGDVPVVVISAGKRPKGPAWLWEQGWAEAQERLAALSRRSAHIIAERTGHAIAWERPALAAAAVRAVVDAARGGAFDLADVRRRARAGGATEDYD